ncbi:MAG: hypothetical protein K2X97_22805, partial [Mycobacteriaceae bacterium]|nr:hypothetical protein [Mycobacteriaceae bacterium]
MAPQSALAKDIGDPVLPHRHCYTFDDTHSIYVPNEAELDWNTALTCDPQVRDVLHKAIEDAPKALDGANLEGCPSQPKLRRAIEFSVLRVSGPSWTCLTRVARSTSWVTYLVLRATAQRGRHRGRRCGRCRRTSSRQ